MREPWVVYVNGEYRGLVMLAESGVHSFYVKLRAREPACNRIVLRAESWENGSL